MGMANPIFFPRPLTHQKYFFFENSTSTDPSTTQDSRLNLIYSTLKNLKPKGKNYPRQQIGQKSTFWRIMEKHNFSNPRQQIDQHELVFLFRNHSLPSFYSVFSEIEQKLFKFFFPQTATLAHLAKPSPSTLSAMAPDFSPRTSLKTTVEKNSSFPRTRPDRFRNQPKFLRASTSLKNFLLSITFQPATFRRKPGIAAWKWSYSEPDLWSHFRRRDTSYSVHTYDSDPECDSSYDTHSDYNSALSISAPVFSPLISTEKLSRLTSIKRPPPLIPYDPDAIFGGDSDEDLYDYSDD